jgi:hypothetical protein
MWVVSSTEGESKEGIGGFIRARMFPLLAPLRKEYARGYLKRRREHLEAL